MIKILRKAILILAIFLIGGSTASFQIFTPKFDELGMYYLPVDYYTSPCPIPWGVDVIEWLTIYKWGNAYEAGFWDCSKMTAFTEWALENCGYEAQIKVSVDHAWIKVRFEDRWLLYEATSRRFVGWQPKEFYQEVKTYESIHELIAEQRWLYFDNPLEFLIWFKSEWAWWLTDENN